MCIRDRLRTGARQQCAQRVVAVAENLGIAMNTGLAGVRSDHIVNDRLSAHGIDQVQVGIQLMNLF